MRITFIGSGNVATHMAAALKNAGHGIVQVYSPNFQHASLLAYHVKAEPVSDLAALTSNTDLIIISVKDDAIADAAKAVAVLGKPIAHTSGATSLTSLLSLTQNCGVFYPLQTFSKEKEVNFLDVPLCIEGSGIEMEQMLIEPAQTISNKVYKVDSEQRRVLHLAAVFACNFPNYLYTIAGKLLEEKELDFDIIRPLIKETADKVQIMPPASVQTGPAIRNDVVTMRTHLDMLQDAPFLQKLYELMSEGIGKMANIAK